ncbi:SDR family oxidoreductase [Herbiconiux ginsengi]|uniref:Nucleoside-diphosphate-sugar epimerase n=1 Tax=Herbiconiux ginsengi TaxID=381665 RepID=A0A1H3PE32_9MICO|nr:aldehyde reductase [Herbiconiux ginsengi]SDY99327.1 Nucleoside-diphosphate-sugar epimerase [Herbiconiux ginsengi]
MSQHRVLVTGGSGFIAGHTILQLIEEGHLVRTTVRSAARESAVRGVLADAGLAHPEALDVVVADLEHDAGWAEAVDGVDFVLHVASPVQPGHVENEDDLIRPAVDGALRVLRAARDAGVSRVVLTSAFHAVSWGYPPSDHVFSEDDWTVLDGPDVDAYGKSKTLAERAAWDFIAAEGGSMELTTMLPVAVMGPVMGSEISGANQIVQRMLAGALPALPPLWIPVVDVRDVARAHLLAMTASGAAGERILLSNGPALALTEIAALLRERLGAAAARVPSESMPGDPGQPKLTSNEKAHRVLGWEPRPAADAILAAAESLLAKHLVDPRA